MIKVSFFCISNTFKGTHIDKRESHVLLLNINSMKQFRILRRIQETYISSFSPKSLELSDGKHFVRSFQSKP